MIERGRLKIAIAAPDSAAADGFEPFAGKRRDDDAVVVAVADEEAVALFIGQDLAGVAERRRLLLISLEGELNRFFVEQFVVAVVGKSMVDDGTDGGGLEFAAVLADEVAFGVDESDG